jgi:hypothetical protein
MQHMHIAVRGMIGSPSSCPADAGPVRCVHWVYLYKSYLKLPLACVSLHDAHRQRAGMLLLLQH